MEKKITINIPVAFVKIIFITIIVFLILMFIDQTSVMKNLNGDGKIHHAIIKADAKNLK
ncbi:MAG: hypothetical protein ACTHOB_01790 [Ginsengibacter sp.]